MRKYNIIVKPLLIGSHFFRGNRSEESLTFVTKFEGVVCSVHIVVM